MHKIAQYKREIAGVSTLLAVGAANATAPATVAELASSVSFADVGLAILAVAGAVLSLYLIWKGAKFVVHAVKGA